MTTTRGSKCIALAARWSPVSCDAGPYQSSKATRSPIVVFAGGDERFAPTCRQTLEVFVRALRGEQDPHASVVDGVRAQAIAEAAVLSALEGQPVRVPELSARRDRSSAARKTYRSRPRHEHDYGRRRHRLVVAHESHLAGD